MTSPPVAAALDLGSTRLKLAVLRKDATLTVTASEPFPLLAGGERYEIDAEELFELATRLLELAPRKLPVGIASQRSSFVLWDRRSGELASEAISWRDRRALGWCEAHRELAGNVESLSGLRLSPHYAGPKLAALLEERPALRERARRGEVLFGTLESFLLWRWSDRRVRATDPTMAARTLLADPRTGRWSPLALEMFGVPAAMLPKIEPTSGRAHELSTKQRVAATIADQASGFVAVARGHDVLVNLGTGGFVLRGSRLFEPRPGYLCGPVLWQRERSVVALEGTINGGGSTLQGFGPGPTELEERDREPELFASPDDSGLGAPWWIAGATVAFSREDAPPDARRRAWLEGLVFRLRQIVDDLATPRARVLLSGGLASEPYVAPALAACLARPVERLEEPEATLLGAARLAAELEPYASPPARTVEPDPRAAWLAEKYPRWLDWMKSRWGGKPG
jgi:glycerol kinase